MQHWDEVEDFLLAMAAADLAEGPDVSPCLVAFAGDEPLLVAFVRSFAKGEYADPIIELLALAVPLEADRLALSIAGRAWSFDDPIPPVVPGVGDLRQRVVTIHTAQGADAGVVVGGSVHPFTTDAAGVRWQPALRDTPAGWIPSALELAVERRGALRTGAAEIRRQARRCLALGHDIGFSAAAVERMGLDAGADLLL